MKKINRNNLMSFENIAMGLIFLVGAGSAISLDYIHEYNLSKLSDAEIKNVIDVDVKVDDEARLAYYIQEAGIKLDGSITNPAFFAKLNDQYKTMIVFVKDNDKDTLKRYLSMKISRENRKLFDAEVGQVKVNTNINQLIEEINSNQR